MSQRPINKALSVTPNLQRFHLNLVIRDIWTGRHWYIPIPVSWAFITTVQTAKWATTTMETSRYSNYILHRYPRYVYEHNELHMGWRAPRIFPTMINDKRWFSFNRTVIFPPLVNLYDNMTHFKDDILWMQQ